MVFANYGEGALQTTGTPSSVLFLLLEHARSQASPIPDVSSLLKAVKREKCNAFFNYSFSDDLLYYIAKYKSLMGSPNLVICLDSEATTREQLTITSSLRGYVGKIPTIRI